MHLDEEGLDEGGLTRELWSLVRDALPGYAPDGQALFTPLFGEPTAAFVPAVGCTSEAQLEQYRLIGCDQCILVGSILDPIDHVCSSSYVVSYARSIPYFL